MKWLEVIELRSASSNLKNFEPRLKTLMEELHNETKMRKIIIYNRFSIDSDYSIHIHHDTNEAEINRSPMGLHLAAILKELGLVNHTVWIENKSENIPEDRKNG